MPFCAAYLRKSRDRREIHDPEVLARHRAIIGEVMQANGHEGEVFEEVGSGERIASRPVFQRLLAAISALPNVGRLQVGGVLYCIDTDRLARGVVTERGQIQDLLVAKGIIIQTPTVSTDLRNTDQRLLHNVKGALAEWELGKYKERVARTRSLQVRQGQVRNGRVPYGYEWDLRSKQPVAHPEEFTILQEICQEAFICSLYDLSARYGLPRTRIYRALTSPMICGWPAKTTGQKVLPSGQVRVYYLPRSEWIWPEQPGPYPAAISRPSWERLQETLKTRRKGKAGLAKENNWCRDVVRINGEPARLGTANNHTGDVPTYEAGSTRLFVSREIVHSHVKAELARLLADEAWLLEAVLKRSREEEKGDILQMEQQREQLREQLIAQQRYLGTAKGERLLSVETIIEGIEAELEGVKRRIADAQREIPPLSPEEAAWVGEIAHCLSQNFEASWAEFLDHEKRMVVRLLIERVGVVCVKRGKCYERTICVTPAGWLSK